MKTAFNLIAGLSFLAGIAALLMASMNAWNLALLVSGLMALIYSYAWSLIGEMWKRLEAAERKLSRLE